MPADTPPLRSHTGRKILIGLAIFAVIVAVAVSAAFWLTSGAVKEAERFLRTNATQGPNAAWRQASPGFQAAITPEGWAALSKSQGLSRYTEASWNRRSVSGHEAKLGGTITLADGGRMPAEATLIEDASGWKVQSFGFGTAGAAAGSGELANSIPGETIASACRDILAKNAGMELDSATCPAIAGVEGAAATCTARRGADAGSMQVTIKALDANGGASLDCEANLVPPAP